jgi:hypothetical protein
MANRILNQLTNLAQIASKREANPFVALRGLGRVNTPMNTGKPPSVSGGALNALYRPFSMTRRDEEE